MYIAVEPLGEEQTVHSTLSNLMTSASPSKTNNTKTQ